MELASFWLPVNPLYLLSYCHTIWSHLHPPSCGLINHHVVSSTIMLSHPNPPSLMGHDHMMPSHHHFTMSTQHPFLIS